MTAARIDVRLVASVVALIVATICASAWAGNTYLICNYPADQADWDYGGTDTVLGQIVTDGYTGSGGAAAHIIGETLTITSLAGSASMSLADPPVSSQSSLIFTPDMILLPQGSDFATDLAGGSAAVSLEYDNGFNGGSTFSYGYASQPRSTELAYWDTLPSGAPGSIAANDPWVIGFAQPEAPVGTVTVSNGLLQLTHSSMNALLAPGMSWPLAASDTVSATASGSGSVTFSDGSYCVLSPNSAFQMAGTGDIDLMEGLIEFIDSNQRDRPVHTRNAVTSSRGTDYTVSFAETDGWDTTTVHVNGGTVDVTGENGGVYELTAGQSETITSHLPELWQASAAGSWTNVANWSSQTSPNGAGWQAVLGGSPSASCTLTLDGSQTIGSLTFNNGTASYTLSAGSGGTLTLNNSGGTGSQIVVLAGSHSIAAPVEIAGGDLTVTESSGGSLAISEEINDDNGAESLTLNGDGTGVLVLSGTNTYGGGTIVEDGTLVVTNPAALLAGGNLTVGAEAASIFTPVAPATQAGDAPTAVPEPSPLVLLGFGAIGFMRRKWLTRIIQEDREFLPLLEHLSYCKEAVRGQSRPGSDRNFRLWKPSEVRSRPEAVRRQTEAFDIERRKFHGTGTRRQSAIIYS